MARADAYLEELFQGESYLGIDYEQLSQKHPGAGECGI
jgi:hypothetical protein